MEQFVNEVVGGVKEKLGCDVEVAKVSKANGVVFTGVRIREDGSNLCPVIYLDEYYKNNLPVVDTINAIIKIYNEAERPSMDMNWYTDFANVKPKLRARLYNKKTEAEVFISASEYGFDDLIIVPYVDVEEMNGSIKVKKEHLDIWDVCEDDLIKIAMENTKEDCTTAMFLDMMEVATTKDGAFGAIAAVLLRDKLKEEHPDGYVVIPSSIHECIILPMVSGMSLDEVTNMVKMVNTSTVRPEDVLSDHAYEVK